MSLFLCFLLLTNLHIFEITGISDRVSSYLYMSATIFFCNRDEDQLFIFLQLQRYSRTMINFLAA